MIIEVYRGAGAHQGEAVKAGMLPDSLLVQRGLAEMDANAHMVNVVALDVVPRAGVRLGQLIEVTDPTSAQAMRGKVTGIKISVRAGSDGQGPQFDHILTVEVPVA